MQASHSTARSHDAPDGYSGPEPDALLVEQAIRRTTIAARRWLESFAHGWDVAAGINGGPVAEQEVRRAFQGYIDTLLPVDGHGLVQEMLQTYQHELTQPLAGSSRAQAFTRVLRAAFSGDR